MKLRYLLSALAGIALLASCVEEPPVKSYDLAIGLDKSTIGVSSDGGTAEVVVNSGEITWTATCSEKWVTFDPATGSGTTKVTITVPANDEDRTAEIIIKAAGVERILTVIQTGNPHGLLPEDPLTVNEAVAICEALGSGGKTGKKYYVKGIISEMVQSFVESGTYGNATFWMSDNGDSKDFEAYRVRYKDDTLYNEYTGEKQDVGVGDEVVIYGLLMNYNGTPETVEKNAYLYSQKSNTDPVITCKEATKTVAASDTEAKFVIEPKNLTEGWTVTTEAAWITDWTKSGAKDATEITVTFSANEATEAREATLTVKSSGAKDLVLTLKQGGFTASGTLEKPYTIAEVIAAIDAGTAAGRVYIKGIVSQNTTYNFVNEDTGATYQTASFWLSDDGVYNDDPLKDFEAYSAYYLGGSIEEPTAKENVKVNVMVGDEVILYGEVTKYKETRETASKKAKVYSINWATSDENGVGNVKYPFNTAGAKKFIDDTQAAVAAAKEKGETLTLPDVAVAGKINEIVYSFSAEYGTATFWTSDDGSAKDFEAYSVYFLENKPWEEGMTQIAVGDEVILKGQLTKYKDTYETSSKKAYVYSLNGVTEASSTPAGPSFAIDGDFSEWADVEEFAGSPRNNGGDNTRINKWKVASDADNVYFYFELVTSKFITDAKKPNSYFYIGFDTDNDGSTGSAHGNVPGLEQYAVIYPCVADSDPVAFINGVDPRSTVNGSSDGTLTTWGAVDASDGTKAYVELAIPRAKVSLTAAGTIAVGASFQEYDTKMQILVLQ